MRIGICDDDIRIREQLTLLVSKHDQDADIKLFSSSEEMLSSGAEYDIYFLDIEMDGISGIELAKEIRKAEEKSGKRSIIVFVTGFKQYMEDAFDVNAFHYLVKPIKEEKFKEVFERAEKEIKYINHRKEQYIIIKSGESRKKILFNEIQYVESCDRKVVFHMDWGVAETYARMYVLENKLGETFFRSHRGYLVNIEKITSYTANSISLLNGDTIMLAEKKYTDFVKAYLRYAKNGGIVNA